MLSTATAPNTRKQRKGGNRKKNPMRKRNRVIKYNTSFTSALPTLYRSILNYHETSTITYSVSNPTSSVFWKLNDLYDPNISGTGHQSKFSDQLYNLYQYGRCLGYDVTLKVVSDSEIPMEVAFGPLTQGTITSHDSFCEDKMIQKRIITNNTSASFHYKSYVDTHLGNPKGTAFRDDIFKQTRGSPLGDLAACWFCISAKRIYLPEVKFGTLYFSLSFKQFTVFSTIKDIGQS